MQEPLLVIGSAHVVDLESPLRAALDSRTLDAMAVELDAERAQALLGPHPESHGAGAGAPFFARLWAVIQRRLGDEIGGGVAGAEMRVAAQVAQERKIPLFLVDDPIRDTLGELIRSLSFRERVGLVLGSIMGLLVPRRLVTRQIDQYARAPDAYLTDMRQAYPTLARVLVDDRNEHMAARLADLRQRGYGRMAVVVGDAHVSGLTAALHRRGIPVRPVPFSELRTIRGPSAALT
jgi:pheromone shutdown protein TraB